MATPSDAQKHADANRQFFDNLASTYDAKPWQRTMRSQIIHFLRQNLDFIGVSWSSQNDPSQKQVRLLDYACGTGLVSSALSPHITHTIGMDLSPNMVDRFNAALPANFGRAIVGDLLTPEPPPSGSPLTQGDLFRFDLAAVGLGFHHFADPALAVRRLAERLDPGGVLLIIDFAPFSPHTAAHHGHGGHGGDEAFPKAAMHTIHRHGFGEEDMRELFEGGGLRHVGYRVMEGEVEMRIGEEEKPVSRKVFLGRADKM